jgi:hypothetical protein
VDCSGFQAEAARGVIQDTFKCQSSTGTGTSTSTSSTSTISAGSGTQTSVGNSPTSSSTETELPQGGRHEKTELPAKVEALEKPKELSANSWGPVPEAHELYTNERYEAEG